MLSSWARPLLLAADHPWYCFHDVSPLHSLPLMSIFSIIFLQYFFINLFFLFSTYLYGDGVVTSSPHINTDPLDSPPL